MPSPARDFGVQSYCFRHFKDNTDVARKVKEIGLDRIEVCAVHADFTDASAHEQVIQTYRDAGVQIVSIGVQTFVNDPDKERTYFEFARKAGCRFISANFQPGTHREAIDTAAGLAREYGMRVAIHNHGGYHWLGNSQMLNHIFSFAPKEIGLCMDTAWALDARQNPLEWADQYRDRLFGLHYKDFTFDEAGKGHDAVVGTGNLNLPALLDKLDANGFDGYAVIEYEADPENPVPALKNCVDKMRGA